MIGYHLPRPQPPAIDPSLILLACKVSRRYRCSSFSREDLEQEAILLLLQALPLYLPQRHGPLEGFITNRIRAHLSRLVAREQRQLCCPLRAVASEPADLPADDLVELSHLHLPARWAVILELTASGSSDAEIAGTLSTSVAAVQKARSLAIARLRKILQAR